MEKNDITKTLKFMCSDDDPQDKKLLLLAELVETRCSELALNQEDLKTSLSKTNAKLDEVTKLLKAFESSEQSCPVYKERVNFEKLGFFMKYPRFTFFVLVGLIVLLTETLCSGIINALKLMLGF